MLGFFLFFVAVLALSAYPVAAFYIDRFVQNWPKGKRRLVFVAVSIAVGCLGYLVRMLALALLHLLVLVLLSMAIHGGLKKLFRGYKGKLHKSGLVPLVLTVSLLVYGYCNINYVQQIAYQISSDKLQQDYRVVFLSDIHYGTVQRMEILEEKVQQINDLQPDLIILGGDLLDEGTSREEMQSCFAALGNLESTYGTYYIHGNHDRQRYSGAPAYTETQLQQTIEANGITILQENLVLIAPDLQLLGREDLGAGIDRGYTALDTDPNRFLITADHQPFDAQANAAFGTDLQLSGHTHGGQIFPLGLLSFFFQGYPYGEYAVGDMTLLVSSGFAGWGFPVRTQGRSEYLVVELSAE